MKRCYYEILGVQPKCTASQIKTAYRKMALKYHPDKNPQQQAKQIFVELTDAYNVLSDPNQRTWYDNNREKILFNKEDMSKEDLEEYTFGFNIWQYFTTQCFKGYGDQKGQFFDTYRTAFQKIKAEQTKAYALRDDMEEIGQMRKYEGFGDSTTIIEKVLKFYEDWQNFTTYKSFVWVQDWDTRQAPNRYVKREMQKQNKKQRQKQKKNYIKTIKDLTSFVKKRDPRVLDYLIKLKQQQQEKQKLRKQQEEQKKKEKAQQKKIKQKLEQQKFKQIEQYYKKQNLINNPLIQNDDYEYIYEDKQERQCQFYCQICNKEFKNQNQLINHEKSGKHKANLKTFQKQVMSPEQLLKKVQQQTKNKQQNQQQSKKKKKKRNKNKNTTINNIQKQQSQQQQCQQKQKKDNIKKQQQQQIQKQQIRKQPTPQKQNKKKKNKNKNWNDQILQKPVENLKLQQQQIQQEEQIKVTNNKSNKNKKKNKNKNNVKQLSSSDQEEVVVKHIQNKKTKKQPIVSDSQSSSENDTQAFMAAFGGGPKKATNIHAKVVVIQDQKNKKKNKKKVQKPLIQESSSEDNQQDNQDKKKGKAKLKKEKKAAKQKQGGFRCNVCSQAYPSKTKLFDHVKKMGHAKAV